VTGTRHSTGENYECITAQYVLYTVELLN